MRIVFSGRGFQFDPPPPFKFQELIKYQHNFTQLLHNLFKVCWKRKNAAIICYKWRLSFFITRMYKKIQELMKINKNLNDKIKSYKKLEFHPLFRRYIFGTPHPPRCVKHVTFVHYVFWNTFIYRVYLIIVLFLILYINSSLFCQQKSRRHHPLELL